MEFWKPITDEMVPGVKPIYYISNIGNIYNVEKQCFFNVDLAKCKRYVPVTLTLSNKKQVHLNLHRLVCMAFNGMPVKPYTDVDHKNFDKLCNCDHNLEWVEPLENYRRAYLNGRMNVPKSTSKKNKIEGSTTISQESRIEAYSKWEASHYNIIMG